MASTDFFVGSGVRRNMDFTDKSQFTSGTSTTATSFMELRMQTVKADGTTATGLQRIDVLKFLRDLQRWLKEGGLLSDGTNVPIP